MYAVIRSGGKQYRVTPGQTVRLERLEGEAGSKIQLGDVLMVEDGGKVQTGAPLPNATVEATIIDVIEQPSPDVVAVTEYKSVETTTHIPVGGEPESGEGAGPAGTSSMFQDQGERPGHEAEEAA